MARKLKTDLWKKSYLIEFIEGKDVTEGEDVTAFTFSVPPESEEITYSQRKSETKTFGGLHVDDYGLDAVKITLSGSTINRDLKRIYSPKNAGADKWMSGEQEIYYLRNLIEKYKKGGKEKETKIMLYDLSKMNYLKGQASVDGTEEGAIKNYWRVFPGDFKIRRSSDRPFTYKYSIEFTAVDMADSERVKDILAPTFGLTEGALEKIRTGVEVLGRLMEYFNTADTWLDDVNSSIRDVTEILDLYADVLMGYIDVSTNIFDTGNEILRIPADVTVKVMNIGLDFANAAKRLLQSLETGLDTVGAIFDEDSPYWEDIRILAKTYNMTETEYTDLFEDFTTTMKKEAEAIVSDSKSGSLPDISPGADSSGSGSGREDASGSGSSGSGSGTEDSVEADEGQPTMRQSVVLSYGDFAVTLKSTDSLESLAAQYCGSPDKAMNIAYYNGIASIDELKPGDAIRIPVLTPSGRNSRNRIYARREDRDNYGRDIYLDGEGYTAASTSGDYRITGGVDNLNQAILLRLRESVNKRIRLNAYGIRTNISDPAAGVAYIISSIDSTVRGDPRVSAVNNIKFSGAGDGLDVTVEYTDIDHADGSATGRA
jgi:hypothetical protein